MRTGTRRAIIKIPAAVVIIAVVISLPLLYWMFSGARTARKSAQSALNVSTVKVVTSALDTYRAVHAEYPEALGSLLQSKDELPPYISPKELQLPGYTYEYAVTPDDFALRLNPDSGQGEHYYTDKNGQVRVSLNSPATSASPFWAEGGE
ncbi:MAG: hypothetical protein K8I00_03390 [Candidatus Omnitrophica bacterium]|nr:hypothetical protein [Candidatus Omnitrophota bacterium]